LKEHLKSRGVLDEVGGIQYLTEISSLTPTAALIDNHTRIVQEKYLKRRLIEVAGNILKNAYSEATDALEEIDSAEAQIFSIAEKLLHKNYSSMKTLAHQAYEMIVRLSQRSNDGLSGLPTGFIELDQMLGGLQNSDLIIIAARPSMGKTAFALSMVRNIVVGEKMPVAFFSLEMTAIQLVLRLISAEAQINQQKLRTGRISSEENTKIISALGKLADAPLFIDDTAGLPIMELRAKARRLKYEHNIKLLVVDYLQLIHPPKAESREREISIISQSLKNLAKELDIPIIALAQLNRLVENRADKRPMLSDLRESGSIEQDADVVMFINRPEVYKIMKYEDGTPTENTAEIIIGKQRNGPTGIKRLAFVKDFAQFGNLAYQYEEPPYQDNVDVSDF
ncbi:MAG TPA: replicative DNA helicase, partial [Candidatus Kapabacteria bacterium]|nr:replicative DNA helicase [Candidatus Kapabacteria bacterium]